MVGVCGDIRRLRYLIYDWLIFFFIPLASISASKQQRNLSLMMLLGMMVHKHGGRIITSKISGSKLFIIFKFVPEPIAQLHWHPHAVLDLFLTSGLASYEQRWRTSVLLSVSNTVWPTGDQECQYWFSINIGSAFPLWSKLADLFLSLSLTLNKIHSHQK